MSDFTEREAFENSQKSASSAVRADTAQIPSDLEERLAEARLKRQKILAAKGKSDSRPKVKRPAFLEPEKSSERASAPITKPDPRRMAKTPEDVARADARAAKAARFALLEPQEPLAAKPPEPRQSSRLSLSRIAAVGFACFFGLGFGMVLSLGAVVGLGWVSVTDVATRLGATDPVDTRAPVVYDQSYQALNTPLVNVSASPPTRFIELAIKAPVQKMSALAGISHPDLAPRGMLSPGPRVTTFDQAAPLTTKLDATPAFILTSFETPTRAGVSPLQSLNQQANVDGLPVLFEVSPIKVLSDFSDMITPSLSVLPVVAPASQGSIPVVRSVPSLLRTEPDQNSWAEPGPIAKPVYSLAIENWTPTDGSDTSSSLKFAGLNPAPDPGPAITALAAPAFARSLPLVEGPFTREPSLALTLAEQGADIRRVALVTYAPRSVSEPELSRSLAVLAATGFPIEASNRVKFKVSKSHVRFYKRADEKVARAIAQEIGGEARDFSRSKTSAPSGHIEIWFAGTRSAAAKPKTKTTYAQRQAFLKARLKDRLVNSLRRGEHLGSTRP
ncbi:hypothetical protein [uncultured Roseobacter sp.]|uniref:hypothetical protein n=1 Tax=uncultured Roseobacter sp. TaxID=114847 RepID=UPI00261B70FB|nr:hypothetical protein [uncultured Roseobacter sp.]